MAQVPYTGTPTITPQFQATPSVNVASPEAAFGGATAAATQHLGGALGHVGDELFSRAYALQSLDQQMDAANANSKFAEKSGQLLEEFRQLQGKDPKAAYPTFVENINKAREEAAAGLTSPLAQKTFLTESRSQQARLVISAGAHAGDQFKNYLGGTAKAEIDTSKNIITTHPEDDEVFKTELGKIDSKADFMKDIHGWSDTQRDDFRTNEVSSAVFLRAKALAEKGQVQKAQEIVDKAAKDGLVTGEDAGRAGIFIRNQRNSVTSRVETANLLSGEGGHFGLGKVSPDVLLQSIGAVESNKNYAQIHPTVTHKVNGVSVTEHGLGAYGIMQSNLQPWLKEAGMPSMTDDEFLHNPKAQDDLAKFKLSQYQDKYGSANEAASHWRGLADKDIVLGETKEQYLKKFNVKLASNMSTSDVRAVGEARAKQIVPDDPEFHQIMGDKVQAEHSKAIQAEKQAEFDRKNVVESAIQPGPDGKLVTSIDEVSDPKVHEAWNNLSGADRAKYNAVLARNAKGDYAPTQENQASFRQWWGRLNDPMASDDDRKKALEADFASMPMPWGDRVKLMNLQKKVFGNLDKNPVLTGAIRDLYPMMENAGVTPNRSKEDYHQFIGVLDTAIQARMLETGKPMKQDEIRVMGAQALRQISHPWFGGMFSGESPAFKESEIPKATKNQIIQKHQEIKGFPPDEATIQQIWAAGQLNDFYAESKLKAQQ